MPPPHLSQTTQPHPTIHRCNTKTEILSSYILQPKCQRFTQSQDWRNSLYTTHTKYKNWTPGLIIRRVSPRTYRVRTLNGGIYIRNRKFIRPRYTDSKQSLETAKGDTKPAEHTPQNHRPKQTTKRPQRLKKIMNYIQTDNLRPY